MVLSTKEAPKLAGSGRPQQQLTMPDAIQLIQINLSTTMTCERWRGGKLAMMLIADVLA